jgi:hypothetical protein
LENRHFQRSVLDPPRTPTASTMTSELASEYSELAPCLAYRLGPVLARGCLAAPSAVLPAPARSCLGGIGWGLEHHVLVEGID